MTAAAATSARCASARRRKAAWVSSAWKNARRWWAAGSKLRRAKGAARWSTHSFQPRRGRWWRTQARRREGKPVPWRVLLVDDHNLVRAGIRALLESLPQVEVVGEASDGREALNLATSLKPDVVLMDIAMKGMNGLEATARLKQASPAMRVIILSMYATEDYVMQALHAGACGYLVKESATLELERALQAVMRGETYL